MLIPYFPSLSPKSVFLVPLSSKLPAWISRSSRHLNLSRQVLICLHSSSVRSDTRMNAAERLGVPSIITPSRIKMPVWNVCFLLPVQTFALSVWIVLVYLAVQPETKLLPVRLPMLRPSVIFSRLLTILSFPPPPPAPYMALLIPVLCIDSRGLFLTDVCWDIAYLQWLTFCRFTLSVLACWG